MKIQSIEFLSESDLGDGKRRLAPANFHGCSNRAQAPQPQPTFHPPLLLLVLAVSAMAERARGLASGVNLCKDLVGAPANVVTPESMAEVAKHIAASHGMEVA